VDGGFSTAQLSQLTQMLAAQKEEEKREKTRSGHNTVATGPIWTTGPRKRRRIEISACSRCGRDSHTSAECHARTHLDGRPLHAPQRIRREEPAGMGALMEFTSKMGGIFSPFAYMSQFVYTA
tara:strand:+ start:218 stop:586 length:369 start_codon:yes stop_codon:yes gene_type:complete